MTTRLLFDDKNEKYNVLNFYSVLNHETWPDDVYEEQWVEGEIRLKQLNKIIK